MFRLRKEAGGEFLRCALCVAGFLSMASHSEGVTRSRPNPQSSVCVTICNHWSYTGIGWQLGVESDVLSLMDAMELYDSAGVKTCIDMDTRAYEKMAAQFPEITKRLVKYLKAGQLELTGGTYGQSMGTMFSGESDIRQIVYGRQNIEKIFGYEPQTFLNEEEFTFPQLPQILESAGYRYASLAQLDTWGKAGVPVMEVNSLNWKGKDGTTIPTTPENALFRAPLSPGNERDNWTKTAASPQYQKLRAQGKPLFVGWEEFGWESPENPAYKTDASDYKDFAQKAPVEYVTLTEYLDKYGASPKNTEALDMDAWNKSLTWGLGGDQLRIYNNQVEGKLLAAERFDAIASTMGIKTRAETLDAGWKDLLASQSHDVGLCEYSRWQQDRMAPLDRVEDHHNFTWGALGYNLLDSANKAAQSVLDSSLATISSRTISNSAHHGQMVCTVFNPCAWARTDIVQTDRIYPIPPKSKSIVVQDGNGKAVPTQLVDAEKDGSGNLIVAKVAFLAKNVPSVGYDTYSVHFAGDAAGTPSDLKVDQAKLTLENSFVRVKIDPATGAVNSLVDKRTGNETLKPEVSEFPVLKGKPNTAYPLRRNIPTEYDSSKSKAEVSWIENGPVRCTVKARYSFAHLLYETYVSLSADLPYAEVTTRVLSEVPPKRDDDPKEIKEGYWLSFAPAFKPEAVIRDYPLAVEATKKSAFHALSFVDLTASDTGLLVLHPGTQYFRFEPNGALSNLIMREWESYYSNEYGWPRYAEYRHALQPHGPGFTNADRLRASTDFNQKLIPVLGQPRTGSLPPRMSFLSVNPEGVQLSEFRRALGGGFELRVADVSGQSSQVSVKFSMLVRTAVKTNLLGAKTGVATVLGDGVSFKIGPWKFQTLALR